MLVPNNNKPGGRKISGHFGKRGKRPPKPAPPLVPPKPRLVPKWKRKAK